MQLNTRGGKKKVLDGAGQKRKEREGKNEVDIANGGEGRGEALITSKGR